MSRSDWGIILTAVGCLILATWGLDSAHNRERHATTPSQHSQRVEQIETDRAGLPLVAESFASNPEPQSTDEREKRDLAAQEAAAVWGFWVAIFAVAQTVATFVGLYFVKRTLDATLKAVQDTNKATIAMEEANKHTMLAQRPWVAVKLTPNFIGCHNGIFTIEAVATFTNHGESAARDVLATVEWIETDNNFAQEITRVYKSCREQRGGGAETILPGEIIERRLDIMTPADEMHFIPELKPKSGGGIFIVIAAMVHYQSPTGHPEGWLETSRSYIIKRRVKTDGRSDHGFALSAFEKGSFECLPDQLVVEAVGGEQAT